ncbi:MAG TPA: M24 family metallopeptidase, partial [Myxococcales bacterium]|nr:M24 family metallopeptidase [Myxococcales bacterium]
MDLISLHRAHVAEIARSVGAALENLGFSRVVVHSGTPVKRTAADDQYWPLRPTPHFQHWLPLAEPGCLLVIEPGKRPVLVRPSSQSFWEALPAPESDHFWSSFDVVEVAPPLPPGRAAFIGDDLAAAAALGISDVNPPALVQALDALRVRKTPYEIACLAEANRRAASGHDELRRLFGSADRSELELHLAFLGATRQDDAETPYKNIVALGKHAATLHHISYEKRAQPAQSLLVDAAASFAGYCADVTRTWVKGGGAAGSAFAGLVAGVEAMQQRLCAAVEVGMPYEQLHDESHRQVGGILRAAGISR